LITAPIEVNGEALEAARWGEARGLPILLLHEGLGSILLWKDFPEQLAAATGRQVIAWSRQGHGWSASTLAARRPDYMHREADLLPALHEALGLARAHWLGHSDGASIALIGAAKFPHLVSRLVLEAPHVFVEEHGLAGIGEIASGFAQSDMGERMKRYHKDPISLFQAWSEIWLAPEFRDWNIEALLPQIDAPALLIQGRDDQYGTMAQLDSIESVLPQTTRLELDHCGHAPHFDRTDAVNGAVRAFLDGRD
jgi:pimeloyl-ACP methyl ester carboxylesterase